MYPQDKALDALRNLITVSARQGEIYTQVAAQRAMLALYARCPVEVQDNETFKKSIKSIEDSTRAVAQMLGLHVAQQWSKYYHSLSRWGKFKNKKAREDWISLERRVLSMRAVAAIHEALLSTYPKSINYPEMGRLFTQRDIVQMKNTSYLY